MTQTLLPRGMVTFLFTDIEGSTRLAQVLGDGYLPVLSEHRQLLRATLTDAGGVELFTEGDSYFFAFADACAAVNACASAQRALAAHEWLDPGTRPRVRMGLHTGRAEPHGREYASAEVHRAARVAFAAHGGQILLSAATVAKVRTAKGGVDVVDLGLHRLRGFDGRERLYQLLGADLERDFPKPRTEGDSPHNLPCPVTSFVGRVAERSEVHWLLQTHRLVTVVGPGGAGKSRLAAMVASGLVDDPSYPDGIWHLDLVDVSDPGLVAFAVASMLGLRPEPGRPIAQTLVDHLARRRMLLLLDTCEVLLEPALTAVSTILTGAPGVKVLATSREPLGQPGEMVWRIPSLSLSGARSDAVSLLVERTAAARGSSTISEAVAESEMPHLARIASRLDGLPLALELAAARMRVISAKELDTRLHTELGDGDPLLTLDAGSVNPDRPRHATIEAAVNWSYRTLPTEAAKVLRWLSVFSGAIDLSTVESLIDKDPLHPLTVLVDKSLIQVERSESGIAYRLLHPIRGFAARRLAEAGEEAPARARHCAWATRELERTMQGADGRPVTLSLYAIDPLIPELRGALRWCGTGGSARQGLRIAARLDQWWRERGLAREGRLWLYRLYARLAESGEDVPDAELAQAFQVHALQAAADGEVAEELRFARRSEASARRAGDPGLLVRVLAGRSGALRDAGKTDEAERTCREVIAWANSHGVPGDAIFAIFNLAELLWLNGSLDEAADILAAARPLEQMRPMERGRRTVDLLLGLVALRRGDLVAAHEHLTVALRSRMSYGFHSRACVAIKAIAARCIQGGDHATGVTLFGAAESTTAKLHCGPGHFGPYWKQQQNTARIALGDSAFDDAYARGAAMGLREAAALALGVEHPDMAHGSIRFAEVG